MEGPDLSRVAIAGYDHDWYAGHVRKAAAAESGPWRASFGTVGEADRNSIDLYLSTRGGAHGSSPPRACSTRWAASAVTR